MPACWRSQNTSEGPSRDREEGVDDVNGRQFHSRRMEGAELGVNLGSLGRKETHQGILPTAGVYRAWEGDGLSECEEVYDKEAKNKS